MKNSKVSLAIFLFTFLSFNFLLSQEVSVSVGNPDGRGKNVVVNGEYSYSKFQYIYKPEEIGFNGEITSLAFDISSFKLHFEPGVLENFRITLSHVSENNFNQEHYLTGNDAVEVYNGNFDPELGWNTFDFQNGFYFNGTSNLLVSVECEDGNWIGNPQPKFSYQTESEKLSIGGKSDYDFPPLPIARYKRARVQFLIDTTVSGSSAVGQSNLITSVNLSSSKNRYYISDTIVISSVVSSIGGGEVICTAYTNGLEYTDDYYRRSLYFTCPVNVSNRAVLEKIYFEELVHGTSKNYFDLYMAKCEYWNFSTFKQDQRHKLIDGSYLQGGKTSENIEITGGEPYTADFDLLKNCSPNGNNFFVDFYVDDINNRLGGWPDKHGLNGEVKMFFSDSAISRVSGYQWESVGDVISENDTTITLTNLPLGENVIYYTAIDDEGRFKKDSLLIYIEEKTLNYDMGLDSNGLGFININPVFGVPPYSIDWYDTSDSSFVRDSLQSGIYYAQIIDSLKDTLVYKFLVGKLLDEPALSVNGSTYNNKVFNSEGENSFLRLSEKIDLKTNFSLPLSIQNEGGLRICIEDSSLNILHEWEFVNGEIYLNQNVTSGKYSNNEFFRLIKNGSVIYLQNLSGEILSSLYNISDLKIKISFRETINSLSHVRIVFQDWEFFEERFTTIKSIPFLLKNHDFSQDCSNNIPGIVTPDLMWRGFFHRNNAITTRVSLIDAQSNLVSSTPTDYVGYPNSFNPIEIYQSGSYTLKLEKYVQKCATTLPEVPNLNEPILFRSISYTLPCFPSYEWETISEEIIIVSDCPTFYYEPVKKLNGTYAQTVGSKLFVKYREEYGLSATSHYNVYDSRRNNVTNTVSLNQQVEYGDNRFSFDVGNLSAGYYVMELFNVKGEKWLVRFKID